MKSYHNTSDSFDTFSQVLVFLKDQYETMTKGMVMDYVSVERPYDDPNRFHVEFSCRTPHPDFDILPTNEEIQ